MSNRLTLPVLLVALVALGSWLRGATPSGAGGANSSAGRSEGKPAPKEAGEKTARSGRGPARGTSSVQDGSEEPWRRPLGLYEEFFGLPAAPRESRAAALKRLKKAAKAHRFDLKFLIALVPDPLDSQQSATFDLAMDGIQQGVAYASEVRKGYLPDRIWIPWHDEATVAGKGYRRTRARRSRCRWPSRTGRAGPGRAPGPRRRPAS